MAQRKRRQRKGRKQVKKLKNDNAGITLAELVVTFALMGIFLAAAAAVISSSIMVHAQLSGTMYASTVSETLLDKVTGELAGARAEEEEAIRIGRVYRDGEDLGEGVFFYDREGNPVCFVVEDGLLVMEGKDYFTLDEKAYMGYRITGFSVEQLEGKNVLKVTLSLKNLKNGFIYTGDRTTRCYCFSSDEFKKIISTDIDLNSL
ncbi:hypothetical protein DXB46_07960 [Lachnospiraceae bacterium OM04-12BH]|nr:hypothetical protein DXB46_07960 [Lachnospiraceae bacterium OM04-12BH]